MGNVNELFCAPGERSSGKGEGSNENSHFVEHPDRVSSPLLRESSRFSGKPESSVCEDSKNTAERGNGNDVEWREAEIQKLQLELERSRQREQEALRLLASSLQLIEEAKMAKQANRVPEPADENALTSLSTPTAPVTSLPFRSKISRLDEKLIDGSISPDVYALAVTNLHS